MMATVVDTSVIIDVLMGSQAAAASLRSARKEGSLYGSEVTRVEVLAGMRPHEEAVTRELLRIFAWQSVDESHAEVAGRFGREWLPRTPGIDSADLIIAATVSLLDAALLTRNVKHFPMFRELSPPY